MLNYLSRSKFVGAVSSFFVATVAAAIAFAAQPAQKASAQLVGAGASSITPLADTLRGISGGRYIITGSGAGRAALQAGIVDYVSTDAGSPGALAPDLGLPGGQVAVRSFDIAVGFSYNPNIPGFNGGLTLAQACGLINGDITDWSEITGEDSLPVIRVFPGDQSGITDTVNNGVIIPVCGTPPIPNPPAPDGSDIPNANGNEIVVAPALPDPFTLADETGDDDNSGSYSLGVINTVANTPGAIGYVETAVANAFGLPLATNAETGESTIAQGPNYFIFRADYSTLGDQDGGAARAQAARDLCNAVSPGSDFQDSAFVLGYVHPIPPRPPIGCDSITARV